MASPDRSRLHPSLRASLYVPPLCGPVEWQRVFGGDLPGVMRDLLRLGAHHDQPTTKDGRHA